MGGMWSLCALARVTAFMIVLWRVVSEARRTLARSIVAGKKKGVSWWDVLGWVELIWGVGKVGRGS